MTIVDQQVRYDQLLRDPNLLVKEPHADAERSVRDEAEQSARVREVATRNLLRWIKE